MRTATNSSLHYRACNLCEAICGIEIAVQADHRLDIRGDKDDPFSRGYICPKAAALGDLHYDKDRLKYPVRRTPNGWQRLGWAEAFDEVAQNLKRIHAKYAGIPSPRILVIPPFITMARCYSHQDFCEVCIRGIGFPPLQ